MSYCDSCSVKHCPVDKSGHGFFTFCGHKKSHSKKPEVLDINQTILFDLEVEGD